MKTLMVLAALTSALSASMAIASDCFFKDTVTGFTADSDQSIIVEAGGRYRVTVSFCSDLSFAEQIGFRTFSSMEVCSGDDLIVPNHGMGPETCPIDSITKL